MEPSTGLEAKKSPLAVSDDSSESLVQMITFTLGDEIYGVDIMTVREIRVWSDTTSLPNSPEFILGVINLRGIIVPVFDLRDRFGRGPTTPTKTHAVIIVAVDNRTIGLLVDTVSDIIDLKETDIRSVPEMKFRQDSAFLIGLATINDQMIALISTNKLFSQEVVEAISGNAEAIADAS